MKIKKILIVPSYKLVEEIEDPRGSFFSKTAGYLGRKLGVGSRVYNDEVLFHGDMTKVLGKENVFVFGKYRYHLHQQEVPDTCQYPSCHGTPVPIFINETQITSVMKEIDAVLVSIRGRLRGEIVIREARQRDIPVAMIDSVDHESNYGAIEISEKLCYGFSRGEHFDLYFKKDLPLGYKTDVILPMGPIPVRPESYHFSNGEKDIDIFYSGRPRIGKTQPDRAETVLLVRDNFSRAVVLEHSSGGTFMRTKQYWDYLSRSRLALSPSGRIWDSFRHCEIGLAPQTVLIAPKPYVETVGPFLRDGVNAVLYDTEFRDGRYHSANGTDLRDKIAHYLAHPRELERISEAWAIDVRRGHTVFARSKYVIESMENVF